MNVARSDARLGLAIVVALVAIGLAMLAGASLRGAGDVCVSAPINGTVATWCGDDVPLPTQTF